MVFTARIGSIASSPSATAFHLTVIATLERAAMASGAARSPQSRVAGNRDLSGLRIGVRNGDGRRRSIRCTIHMVPGLWRASGGLVGGPALAAENELAITTARVTYAVHFRCGSSANIGPEKPASALLAKAGTPRSEQHLLFVPIGDIGLITRSPHRRGQGASLAFRGRALLRSLN